MFNTPQVILISVGYSVNLQRTITQTIEVTPLPFLHSKDLIQQLLKLHVTGNTEEGHKQSKVLQSQYLFKINRYSQENKTSFRACKPLFMSWALIHSLQAQRGNVTQCHSFRSTS